MEILEIITVGLPFCAFKIIAGLVLEQRWLIFLGLADFLINLINLFSVSIKQKRFFDACLFSYLVRKLMKPEKELKVKWQDLGNSIDVGLSFLLVAIMIAAGFIKTLNPAMLLAWNISVILNVFGAGLTRLTHSIKNLHS